MAVVRFFAAAREATGAPSQTVDAADVASALDSLVGQYGHVFERLLPYCSVMVDGEVADAHAPLSGSAEMAILPPVAGG